MKEVGSNVNIHAKNTKVKANKSKQSAVFLDKGGRMNICNKTYCKGENEINQGESVPKIWDTKGSFMSKLAKKNMEMKENTPGPGVII